MSNGSPQHWIEFLNRNRGHFSAQATADKRRMLQQIAARTIRAANLLRRLHGELCYLLAFPDDERIHTEAAAALERLSSRVIRLSARQRRALGNSGLARTSLRCEFSYDIARWLTHDRATKAEIDWNSFDRSEALDELLAHVLTVAEVEAFESGEFSTHQWVRLAKGDRRLSDLAWLIRQLETTARLRGVAPSIYDSCEVPLCWEVPSGVDAVRLPGIPRTTTRRRMRTVPEDICRRIKRPLKALRRVRGPLAQALIDAARMSLARRCREVHAFTHANINEVYLADFGQGAALAIFGVIPAQRLSLEANYGYVLLANGIVIGYGGGSPIFSQANTGINIFDEYRRSEAAFLFVNTLRAFYTLFGSTRFIVNPYQFGQDNDEAIASGAFWFYYKLGFRPSEPSCRRAAAAEFKRLRNRAAARSSQTALEKLATGNMMLTLPSRPANRLYLEEAWLPIISGRTTELIAQHPCSNRTQALRQMAAVIGTELNVRRRSNWPANERNAFMRLVPIVGLIDKLAEWTPANKRALVQLMRAKGKPREQLYARLLAQQRLLHAALVRSARQRGPSLRRS